MSSTAAVDSEYTAFGPRQCRCQCPPSFVKVIYSVLFWYISSISITACNKYLFDSLDFAYPVLVTFIHFAFMSILLRMGFSSLSFFPDLPFVEVGHYLRFVLPIALCSAGEIALTNLSYTMVSISVITVLKSSLVVVTYLFAIVLGLEKFCLRLMGVVMFIVASISVTVPGMEIDNALGLVLLGVAVLCAACRWVFVHHQLQHDQYLPVQLMLLTQPLATIFLAPFAVGVDMRRLILGPPMETANVHVAVILVTASIFLGFFLMLAEYNLVRVTSSVSLTVAGVGKEVATVTMSALAFSEQLPARTIAGIGCSIAGILLYSWLRLRALGPKESCHHQRPIGSAGLSLDIEEGRLSRSVQRES
eukprot:Polyplicarium_translucidae@DN1664_c0_g1_i1.p1